MKRIYLLLFTMVAAIILTSSGLAKYRVGDAVADFTLKNTDGKSVSLSDYKDSKGVIVIFDCNTCPYSKAYNTRIIALHEKYAPKGFPLVAINANDPAQSPGDSFDEMVAEAKEKNYKFPYLIDEAQTVAKSFGATNTPHVFLLKNESGNFKVAYIGAIDNNPRDAAAADKKYTENAIESLLQQKQIATPTTKAVGCGIKWKK